MAAAVIELDDDRCVLVVVSSISCGMTCIYQAMLTSKKTHSEILILNSLISIWNFSLNFLDLQKFLTE